MRSRRTPRYQSSSCGPTVAADRRADARGRSRTAASYFMLAAPRRDQPERRRRSRRATPSSACSSVSFQPRNAPIIASILRSPMPERLPRAAASSTRSRSAYRTPPPASDARAARRASPARRTKLNAKPTTMPGQRDRVRQQLMLEIDREQHDQRAAEHEARREQRARVRSTTTPSDEHRRRQRLDDRIPDADRRAAGAAPRRAAPAS